MAGQVNKDLRYLTIGESYWLYRRTLGLTVLQAAERLSNSARAYRIVEQAGTFANLPLSERYGCTEQMRLARRRAKWGLHGTAERAGLSHVTLLLREQGGDLRLRDWWISQGFIF